MRLIKLCSILFISLIISPFAFTQTKEQLLGEWYFANATTPNGLSLNRSFFIKTANFMRGGIVRINEIHNSEWYQDETFEYYVQKDSLFFVRTRTNLDPAFKIRSATFDTLILDRKNELYHFTRILRKIKKRDGYEVYLKEDTITIYDKPFQSARFKGNLSDFLYRKLCFLEGDSIQLLYVNFKLCSDGSISDIEVKNHKKFGNLTDTVVAVVRSSKKYWTVARRGSTKFDTKIGLAILVRSKLLEPFSVKGLFSEVKRLSENGYKSQIEGNNKVALTNYSAAETLFSYFEISSFYNKQSFDLATLDAYGSALINKSIILEKMGKREKACETLNKAKAFSDVAEKIYLRDCN